MMNGLAGKVGIVAGGGAGLGRASARRLGEEGVKVVVSDINAAAAESVAREIREAGGEAVSMATDISSEDEVNALIAFAVKEFGSLQLLHNVAADLRDAGSRDFDLLGTALSDFDRSLAVDLRGYVLTCRAALPHMIESGGGAIVNTSSLAGQRTLRAGNKFAYAIAKSGLGPLTQHIAVRYGQDGIRCNTVAMGMILSETFTSTLSKERIDQIMAGAVVPNSGDPDGYAPAIAFLLSDDARYLTGQTINLDAGASAFV